MDEKMKEMLKELLMNNLEIELQEEEDMYSKDLVVKISFAGEEICSSSHRLAFKGF